MAWQNTLLSASFRGVTFDVVSTNDPIERSVITHEYPYTDGANPEDMGRNGRVFSIAAIFYGEDYENRLEAFLVEIDKPGVGELIHPIWGAIRAQFMRGNVSHDAFKPDTAQVSLEFLEAVLNAPLFSRTLPIQQVEKIDQAANEALAAARAGFAVDIDSALNLPALLREKLSADMLGAIDTMGGYVGQLVKARGWLASGLSYIENPVSFVDDLTGGFVSRVDALYSSLDLSSGYSSGGSGAARGGLATVWRSPVAHLEQPVLPPAAATGAALTTNPGAIQPFLTTHITVQQSLAVASAAAQLYGADLAEAVLTPSDIETVAADARTAIKNAIAAVRQTYPDITRSRPITEPLKAVALNITNAAEKLIHAKPPLRDRVVGTPGNLQLLAHLWYGDYRRSAELQRLNPNVRNPNFIAAGATLRAYAA